MKNLRYLHSFSVEVKTSHIDVGWYGFEYYFSKGKFQSEFYILMEPSCIEFCMKGFDASFNYIDYYPRTGKMKGKLADRYLQR